MTCRAFFLAVAMLAAAPAQSALAQSSLAKPAPAKIKAGIGGEDWGTTQKGDKVRLYTLTGKGGMVARITNFGGVVVDLMVPDRHGKPVNVVLGYDDLASYEKGGVYSALIGRYANRLSFKFPVDSKMYEQPPPQRPVRRPPVRRHKHREPTSSMAAAMAFRSGCGTRWRMTGRSPAWLLPSRKRTAPAAFPAISR